MPEIKKRYLHPTVREFLERKMVFVGGPRQVGKTTLGLTFLNPQSVENPAYLNWDDLNSRAILRAGELPPQKIILIDEIHKFKSWRGQLKGFYDKRREKQRFIITGSAQLDHYRRGGDSLLGRYRYLRLHPLSALELDLKSDSDLEQLSRFGGFPEPFFSASAKELKLWHRERLYRIVNDDIRNLENLWEYSSIELLAEALPERVGSILSVNSLAEDLSVNYRTAESWVKILEQVYYCYRILPFGAPKIRAVKKERKLYLWDWSCIDLEGARFENLVASQLLQFCHFLEDSQGESMELRFLRDVERREIDFVVIKNKKPLFAVECKTGERVLSPHLRYFKQRTSIPQFFQVHRGVKDYIAEDGIRVVPFLKFCREVLQPLINTPSLDR
jgi:predicted AAA+ superfamily ATPase